MKVLEGLTSMHRRNLVRLIHWVLQGCREALQHLIFWPDEASIQAFHRDFAPNLQPYFKNIVFCSGWHGDPSMSNASEGTWYENKLFWKEETV